MFGRTQINQTIAALRWAHAPALHIGEAAAADVTALPSTITA
jgi:hypothetical protein